MAEGDFARHAWLVPAIPIVLLALVVMARFLRHLPAYMRPVLLTGLAVFAAGAIVIEGLIGFIGDDMGGQWWDKVFFPASVALEESLELIGVVLVVAGIVAHLDRVGIFARPSPAAAPPAGTVSAVAEIAALAGQGAAALSNWPGDALSIARLPRVEVQGVDLIGPLPPRAGQPGWFLLRRRLGRAHAFAREPRAPERTPIPNGTRWLAGSISTESSLGIGLHVNDRADRDERVEPIERVRSATFQG